MSSTPDIRYLTNSRIDKKKWDRCVETAGNGLIYGYSFYLDLMAKNWDGIVAGDYEAVMPLPWNSKYGIRYIYQPFLTAQLGVFGNDISGLTTALIMAIPSSFRLIEMPLNPYNSTAIPKEAYYTRSNYILRLHDAYEKLEKGYNDNTRRNIKKAYQVGCLATKKITADEVIGLAVAQMYYYDKQSDENVKRFKKLYDVLEGKNMAVTYGIQLNGEFISSAVFFYSHQRAYYILVGNHPKGRSVGASHALIDSFIKEHAGQEIILDFEGSDIGSLASFYSGFGALRESYPALKINRLPFFLRWMKGS